MIDTGTARISRYSTAPRSSSCRSRRSRRRRRSSGPAAPVARSPGIAIRLYSEEDFERRPEFTEPEILRTSLASVILQMLSLGFGDITSFPFLTQPDSRGVKAAFDLLLELGAVRTSTRSETRGTTGSGTGGGAAKLTDLGREIARLPIDPRFARMLIEAKRHRRAAGRARDRRRNVDPGRARATRGAPRGGRPPARALRRPDERFPDACSISGTTCRSSSPRSAPARSGGSAARSTSIMCACGNGSTCTGSCACSSARRAPRRAAGEQRRP